MMKGLTIRGSFFWIALILLEVKSFGFSPSINTAIVSDRNGHHKQLGLAWQVGVTTTPFIQDRASQLRLPLLLWGAQTDDDGEIKSTTTFVIIGGTGRIGTAIASHLLLRKPQSSQIILVGRDEKRGMEAVKEIVDETTITAKTNTQNLVSYKNCNWKNEKELEGIIKNADCVIHTAGPFLEEEPKPLEKAIASRRCKAYIDVSDPLDFLEKSLQMNDIAKDGGTTALLAAGAFPGMSNVLAMEAASKLDTGECVKDVRFNYFTAGLGGSGDVNLYITNLGFGEPMVQYENGGLRFYQGLSGLLLGNVNFFLEKEETSDSKSDNLVAKERIGSRTVFSWPFPEAATVARELGASGQSSAAMGTAPEIWNTMLGILVALVPRKLWKSTQFSKFLADFSQPLVKLTDAILRITSPDKVGETHAMRVDVTGESGTAVSCVQAHESFRRCVGQSCAEFALDLLEHPQTGVFLPEQRYKDDIPRNRIINKLTTTPGTFAFTGACRVKAAPAPADLNKALNKANEYEESTF